MKILLGIQGTGNGHLSRCTALAEALQQHPWVEVDYLVSGRAPEHFFDMEAFPNWQWRKGLSFAVQKGQIDVRKTLSQNDWKQFWRDVTELDLSPYDLVVTDYEPVVAWAARRQNKRCIGMGRQYAFYKRTQSLRLPWLYQQLIRWFAPATDVVGMHWVADGNHILPPIVHHRALAGQVEEDHYLVYLPFESLVSVHRLLAKFPHYRFSVFHPDAKRQKIAGIDYYPPSRQRFAEQFVKAGGVISNAGFETSCEALAYGKKLLVRPLGGQFEQLANARCLAELGLATQLNELTPQGLTDWFALTERKQCFWPDVASEIAVWLAGGAEQSVAELSRRLWRQADQSDYRDLLRSDLRLQRS
ncbi:glycosyltransferase [Pseudidiomarina sp. 1APR75-33.1]|uniref:glycosyltransferase family protein n=1 Tax=Pseudidiomarina terrestris TaxID=2820060 RepID=UPI0026542DF7|nr:glycosyltransferase family protein [Pseudidiomarina sp. 1APR75-33.1]MDN7126732.1 glycosyltransferase [Pseudidiomarina sp. 1APR75-33.1]